ncbi:hypothetical protein [Salinisphaera aquimarina]|uniref:Uncharacterized protein n=1 Tax=Salinisphaera aquimarina TaxID=2094031 RepID=A0ABV7EKN0_9GAMM
MPSSGEQHRYRVGNHVVVAVDGRHLDHTVASHGIATYRVTDTGDPLRLHAGIDLLNISVDDFPGLSSVDLAPRAADVAELMRDGFDMMLADNGAVDVQPVNQTAMKDLAEQFRKLGDNSFPQAVPGPAVPVGIPAREGARVTLDDFQGLDGLTFTVDRLNDKRAWLSVSGDFDELPPDSPLIQRMAPPTKDVEVSDVKVAARMIVDREHGWITDMTLVVHLRMAVGDKAATIRSITYAHQTDNPLAGDVSTPLNGFSRLPNTLIWGGDLALGQYSGVFTPPPMHEPPQRLEPGDEPQTLWVSRRHLALRLEHGNAARLPYGSLGLKNATAFDADGQALDIPLAFNDAQYITDDDNGWLFDVVPLGWQDIDLREVAEVRAEFGYRRRSPGTPVTLTLDDQRRELTHGDARAVAEPIADTDNAWRVTLSSGGQQLYWLDATTLDGVDGQGWVQDSDSWQTPADQIMLARTDNPRAWTQTLRIDADRPALQLSLFAADNGTVEQTETLRFVDPTMIRRVAPGQARHLDEPLHSDRNLSLDTLAPEPDGRGGLQMDLPVGLDSQCGLSAWVDRPDMPVRLWRKTPPPDNAPQAGMQHWQLTLADGAHADVHDLPLETVLNCPGTPNWRSVPVTANTPWHLDLYTLTGRWPQSTGAAADYFAHVQFLDADDRPLRPMLQTAEADDTPGDWAGESQQHGIRDYVDDSGQIRIWGDVAHVVMLAFEPPAIKRRWPNAAKRRADADKESTQ